MRATDLNLSWVTPRLAVGGRIDSAALPRLARELGFRHVVDLRIECCDDERELHQHGLTLLHLPTDDHHAVSDTMLADGVAWVQERLARDESVYIHCEHGIGRSVLLTWCVLVSLGEPPREALVRIKQARPRASPSPVQIEALIAYCQTRAIDVPSWNDLADIAYANISAAQAESA
jgi:hypothetical protein